MSVVVSEGGVRAGAMSVAFPLARLAEVASASRKSKQTVVVGEEDGRLSGGAAQWGVAGLARHHAAVSCWVVAGDAHVRVVAARALAPGSALSLWPHPALAALVGLPFLTPHHLDGSDPTMPYVCRECGERFAEPYPLKVHVFAECAGADAATLWRHLLQRLSRSDVTAAAHVTDCDVIAATHMSPVAPQPLPLLVTLSTTPINRGHRCSWCGKVYSRRYGLKIHERTHTGARPLRCAECARPFADPSNLNKHRRLHARALTSNHCAE